MKYGNNNQQNYKAPWLGRNLFSVLLIALLLLCSAIVVLIMNGMMNY